MKKLKLYKTKLPMALKARTNSEVVHYMYIDKVLIEEDSYTALGGYYYLDDNESPVVFENYSKQFSYSTVNSVSNVTGDTFTDKYLFIIGAVGKAVLESENSWGSQEEVWEEIND